MQRRLQSECLPNSTPGTKLVRVRGTTPISLLFQALLFFCIALNGCQFRHADRGPSIEFSKIPPAAQGGRERVDFIAGRVTGAHDGQQIVVYARSGTWWVQPWPDRPFISIHA